MTNNNHATEERHDMPAATRSTFQPAGIDRPTADDVNDVLQGRLIAMLDLGLVLKHIHWNLVGPGFLAIHEMLDDHVASVREGADDIAERIATLGGIPNGLAGFMVSNRSWQDYSLGRAVVPAHLGALDTVYDGVIRDHRKAIDSVAGLDPVSEDLLVAQTATLELNQWFVRAHIEDTSGKLATGGASSELDAATAAALADPLG